MEKETQHKSILDTKAVAVKRDGSSTAPKITAKGKGYNAEKILDIAFADGVKVRQDSELTEILDQFEVNSPIPLEALHTVSLILEKVYEYEKRQDELFEAAHDDIDVSPRNEGKGIIDGN